MFQRATKAERFSVGTHPEWNAKGGRVEFEPDWHGEYRVCWLWVGVPRRTAVSVWFGPVDQNEGQPFKIRVPYGHLLHGMFYACLDGADPGPFLDALVESYPELTDTVARCLYGDPDDE